MRLANKGISIHFSVFSFICMPASPCALIDANPTEPVYHNRRTHSLCSVYGVPFHPSTDTQTTKNRASRCCLLATQTVPLVIEVVVTARWCKRAQQHSRTQSNVRIRTSHNTALKSSQCEWHRTRHAAPSFCLVCYVQL